MSNFAVTAQEFLELSSEVRLGILFELDRKPERVSSMAKKFEVTSQEIHRNLDRMIDTGLITKQKDNHYGITNFGKALCMQIPSVYFLSKHKKYVTSHGFGNIPPEFIQRIGNLSNCEEIVGVAKVLEIWKKIYRSADKYIFNVLHETPLDLMELIIKRAKQGVKYKHIISENASVPIGRRNILEKSGFYPLLEDGKIERKMLKSVQISVIVSENAAGIMFPDTNKKPDLRSMFFSKDESFRKWCLDYFNYCWNQSDNFKEFKLQE